MCHTCCLCTGNIFLDLFLVTLLRATSLMVVIIINLLSTHCLKFRRINFGKGSPIDDSGHCIEDATSSSNQCRPTEFSRDFFSDFPGFFFRNQFSMLKLESKQANKQGSKQASKPASNQASGQASQPASQPVSKQAKEGNEREGIFF